MAPSYSFDLLTINDLNNEILHRVYKRGLVVLKIDIHEIVCTSRVYKDSDIFILYASLEF
jgi:hypothetical protein